MCLYIYICMYVYNMRIIIINYNIVRVVFKFTTDRDDGHTRVHPYNTYLNNYTNIICFDICRPDRRRRRQHNNNNNNIMHAYTCGRGPGCRGCMLYYLTRCIRNSKIFSWNLQSLNNV